MTASESGDEPQAHGGTDRGDTTGNDVQVMAFHGNAAALRIFGVKYMAVLMPVSWSAMPRTIPLDVEELAWST